MSEYKVKIKTKDIELEICTDDIDFIKSYIEYWNKFLTNSYELPNNNTNYNNITVKSNISIKEFIALKLPKNIEDYIISIAYFLDKYKYKNSFSKNDILNLLLCVYGECNNIDDYIENIIKDGYLIKNSDNSYSLTFSGELYIKNGLN